ncbi:unnamed protein product [Adineta ricciae]|uniref:Beta-lactamase-related domain-containing protein n=1 Tax=Adineta ricciae TaxID=249248 RepID=A0A814XBQ1_ADIRI|nr:unnamed protein product [Adineta ricciae]CAF1214262.1 unnamed protein product [Adineta ricciae]
MASISNRNYPYKPPVFTDEDRLDKLKNTLPDLKELFQQEFSGNHFPGLIYGLIVDGQLFCSESFGYTNLEQNLPTTTKSLFRIASMTKSITAMAIVKLRDDGKLRLDDPVDKYIPEIFTNELTNDGPIITVRHLLIQDAGMPEDDQWGDQQLALPDEDFLKLLKNGISLSNPPGTIWEYTNLAYAMLGRIITVVSEMPYQNYIKQEILDPLGMTHTIWEYSDAPSELLVCGYRWECDSYSKETPLHHGSFGAMGGLISSIDDFSKYVAYHLQAWPARSEPEYGPLRRSSLREMHHPWNFIELKTFPHRSCLVTSAYCYGLKWSMDQDGVISVSHSGGLPGFGCNWMMLPEYGVGLVSFANSTYADLEHINTTIIDKLVHLADLKPRKLPISKILAERKEQVIQVILNNNWNIHDSELLTIFADNFFNNSSLERRKAVSRDLLDQIGKVVEIEELTPKNQLSGTFHLKGENGSVRILLCLSPESIPLVQELELTMIKQS